MTRTVTLLLPTYLSWIIILLSELFIGCYHLIGKEPDVDDEDERDNCREYSSLRRSTRCEDWQLRWQGLLGNEKQLQIAQR